MESAHRGKQSIEFINRPAILSFASVAGKKEAHGPLANTFDVVSEDTTFGEKTWEKAETQMQKTALQLALDKAAMQEGDLDAAFVGDLLNQCVGSSFTLRVDRRTDFRALRCLLYDGGKPAFGRHEH